MTLAARVPPWLAWTGLEPMNLGLDLRGGAQLLAEVHVEDVYAQRMDSLWPEVRDASYNFV